MGKTLPVIPDIQSSTFKIHLDQEVNRRHAELSQLLCGRGGQYEKQFKQAFF